MLWGGLPEKDALYLNITPGDTDGAAVYKLNVQDVPVDGFWSISVHNAKGYLKPNQYNAYSVNNITAKKNADGSVAVQFGGCDGKIPNCLPSMPDWNYMVRLLSPARRSPERHMEIPRSAARELTSVADMAMSAIVKSSPRRLSATRLRRRRRHPERHCHGNPGWRLGWDEIGGMKPPPDPGYRHRFPPRSLAGWNAVHWV